MRDEGRTFRQAEVRLHEQSGRRVLPRLPDETMDKVLESRCALELQFASAADAELTGGGPLPDSRSTL